MKEQDGVRFVGSRKQPNVGSTADVSKPLSGPEFTIIHSGGVHCEATCLKFKISCLDFQCLYQGFNYKFRFSTRKLTGAGFHL